MRLRRIPPLFIAGAAAAFMLLAGCEDKEPDKPVSATPGPPTAPTGSLLHDGRLDLARRLKLEPASVTLKEVRAAGWDGCLGAAVAGQACPELFVGGYIGWYKAGDRTYRYHFGMGKFVATDFIKTTPDGGSPVPPELMPDFPRLLAQYARHDLAMTLNIDPAKVTVTFLEPRVFFDTCLSYEVPGAPCSDVRIPGVIAAFSAAGKETYYHCGEQGGCVRIDPSRGNVTTQPSMNVGEVELAMRKDLATRLNVPADEVSVATFRRVTWPDGCLGVYPPGILCTQALVEGFLAILTDATSREYRYHGSGIRFIATDFEAGAKVGEPAATPAN